jgi:hypothetical protein
MLLFPSERSESRVLTVADMKGFEKRAKMNNAIGMGDTACFILKKI